MCMQMIPRHHHSLFPLLSTFFIYSLPGHGPHQHALRTPHGRLWCLLHCPAHPAANLRCLLEVSAPLLFFSLPRSTLAYASPYTYPFAEGARLILSTSRAPAITLKCNLRVSFATARTTMSYKCFKCSRRGGFWCTGGGVMIRFLLVHATDGEIMLITLWLYEKMEFLFFFFFPTDFISLSITLISHVCRSFPPLRRYIRSERSIILVNFCLSILASNLLILVGQSQTLSKVGGFLFFWVFLCECVCVLIHHTLNYSHFKGQESLWEPHCAVAHIDSKSKNSGVSLISPKWVLCPLPTPFLCPTFAKV